MHDWRFPDVALQRLQHDTFNYFSERANPANGMVPDNTRGDSPASIAAIGLGLTSDLVAIERGWITRDEGIDRTLATVRFFSKSEQSNEIDATGYKGFYYHFLDMGSGRRVWRCELSTIDTALLLAGMLSAATYFDRDDEREHEIRMLTDRLYRRVDWCWALNGGPALVHGWKPRRGFLPWRWQGYNEALILYVLALGSPTFALPPETYQAWLDGYVWTAHYGTEYIYEGPLFVHQLTQCWLDLREMSDAFTRNRGLDYFENTCRATRVQRAYAIDNPHGFAGYGENCWGITASDGPGPARRKIDGQWRKFHDYLARGVPNGPDDGTLAPWAVVASLPFCPDIVLPALEHIDTHYPGVTSHYGLKCSFNPTFDTGNGNHGWLSSGYFGIDQGPVVLAIENHLSGFVWDLMKRCNYIRTGLQRCGFTGGWLG